MNQVVYNVEPIQPQLGNQANNSKRFIHQDGLPKLTRSALSDHFHILDNPATLGSDQLDKSLLVEIDNRQYHKILSQFTNRIPTQMRNAIPKRQFEYLLGRWCVAVLLIELGCCEKKSWITSDNRQPIWPSGFVGSISHSSDAVTVVVRQQSLNFLSVGIDIESVAHANKSRAALVRCFSFPEATLLSSLEFGLLLGFSAKESLFKCLYPLTNVFFDFLDAEIVSVCVLSQTMRLCLNRSLASIPRGSIYTACYANIVMHRIQVWTAVIYPDATSAKMLRF